MFIPTKNIMEILQQDELINFKQKYIESNKTQIIDDHFVDGNVLYKIPAKRSSTQELLKEYRACTKEPLQYFADSSIFTHVTNKILDIKLKGTFSECINYIAEIRKKAGNNFYGALLRTVGNKNEIINPFHPLVSLSVLNDEKFFKDKVYNVLLYFYTNRSEMDTTYSSKDADQGLIDKNINALLFTYKNALATETRIDKIKKYNGTDDKFLVQYRTKKHPDEDIDRSHYVVAHQLMTRGIICPYYGTSLVQIVDNRGTSGINLSPLKTANISVPSGDSLRYGSVCTGSMNNQTLEGLRTLTHSNLSSAYCSSNFSNGSLIYIDSCINKAFEIYIKAGIIDNSDGLVLAKGPVATATHNFTDEELACTSLNEFRTFNKELGLREVIEKFKQLRKVQNDSNVENSNSEAATTNSVAASN